MFYQNTEWAGDNVKIHFRDSDGEHKEVTMNAHDAVDFNVAFDGWMSRNQDRLLDAMRRADRPRKQENIG